MEKSNDIKALFIIVNAGFAAEVIEIARAAGVKGATILNARGGGVPGQSILGMTVDSEKEMILSLIEGKTAAKVMKAIKEKAGLQTPAHSVCFVLPVNRTTEINNFDISQD